jgi:hypothetical protein
VTEHVVDELPENCINVIPQVGRCAIGRITSKKRVNQPVYDALLLGRFDGGIQCFNFHQTRRSASMLVCPRH